MYYTKTIRAAEWPCIASRPSALRLGLHGLKRVAAQRTYPPKPPLPPKLPRTSCKLPRSSAALLPRPTLSTLSTLTNPKTAAPDPIDPKDSIDSNVKVPRSINRNAPPRVLLSSVVVSCKCPS